MNVRMNGLSLRVVALSFGAVVFGLLLYGSAIAQSTAPNMRAPAPRESNPTAMSVQEQQLLDALKPGSAIGGDTLSGRISIPDQKAANLIQPSGRDWRNYHQTTLAWVGAIAILGMLALLGLFYTARGQIMIEKGFSGRTITRFPSFDRFVHWMTATCFIVLAVSGLNISFGKSLILPLIGEGAFGVLSQWLKYSHNFLAWPFILGIIFMFILWVRDNIPTRLDWDWIRTGGGFLSNGAHVQARRFNAGQKMVFWMVVGFGAAVSVSGYFMIFPYQSNGVGDMQFWTVVHGTISMVFIAGMLAHAYIGSIGMQGAFDAMGTGQVDLNWAREHHALWVDEEMARAKGAPERLQPAE